MTERENTMKKHHLILLPALLACLLLCACETEGQQAGEPVEKDPGRVSGNLDPGDRCQLDLRGL